MRAIRWWTFNFTMLQSTRRGLFRHSYDVTEDGLPVATLTGVRREGVVFENDGAEYRVARHGYKSFTLTGPVGELARADRTNGRMWTIYSMTDALELVQPSMWKEAWQLNRYGQVAGSLRKDGAFKRTSSADLPDDLPLPLRLFIVSVAETLWERSRQAAAAG
jgi:hypothetical protein